MKPILQSRLYEERKTLVFNFSASFPTTVSTYALRAVPLPFVRALAIVLFLLASTFAIGAIAAPSVQVTSITGPTSAQLTGSTFVVSVAYNWSGFASPGPQKLQFKLNVPSSMEIISGYGGDYVSIGGPFPGSDAVCTVADPIVGTPLGSSGVGHVELNVRFKYDVCNNVTGCVQVRYTRFMLTTSWSPDQSGDKRFCATSSASNRWTIRKDALWCQYNDSSSNSILYRISVLNNEANSFVREGTLPLSGVTLTDFAPNASRIEPVSAPPGFPVPSWTGAPANVASYVFPSGPTTLNTATKWYYTYVWVTYPKSIFPEGSTVVNNATLSWVTDDCLLKGSMTDTASSSMCGYVNVGAIGKSLQMSLAFPSNPWYTPTLSPGCCAAYKIAYTNSGTVPQLNLVMTDEAPSGETFGDIKINVPATGMICSLYVKTGSTYPTAPTQVYNSSGIFTFSAASVKGVKWVYSGSALPVGWTITNGVNFCINTNYTNGSPVLPNDQIVNTANVTQNSVVLAETSNAFFVSVPSPKVIAFKYLIGTCNNGVSSSAGPWTPGNVVTYRIAIANVGSSDATSCVVSDMLPAGLTYQGPSRYAWYSSATAYPWVTENLPACNATLSTPSLPFATPATSVTGQNITWTFGSLPRDCQGNPSFLVIDFDVKIDDNPKALAGYYTNCAAFTAVETGTVNTNCVTFPVNAASIGKATKSIGLNPTGSFGDAASIPAGGTGYYKLRFENIGNTPFAGVNFLDILPNSPDVTVLPPYSPRSSQFDVAVNATPSTASGSNILATQLDLAYASSYNPKRSDVQYGFGTPAVTNNGTPYSAVWPWVDPMVGAKSLSVTMKAANNLLPGQVLEVIVPFKVSQTAKTGELACNSFGYQMKPTGYLNGATVAPVLASETPSVCITALPAATGCCDTAYFQPFHIDGLDVDWRTIHVVNRQGSRISYIEIEYTDCTTGATISASNGPIVGGGVKEIRSSYATRSLSVFSFTPPYRRVPTSSDLYSALPTTSYRGIAQNEVLFNVGFNYFGTTPAEWCMKLTIHHADSTVCTWSMPKWKPGKPTTSNAGASATAAPANLYGLTLTVDPSQFKEEVHYFTLTPMNPEDRIVGGSGGEWASTTDSGRTPIVREFVQSANSALFTLDASSLTDKTINVFVSAADKSRRPSLRWKLFDGTGTELSSDTVQASSAVSLVTQQIQSPSTTDVQITGINPNPASRNVTIDYHLGANGDARLEAFSALGEPVAVLASGSQSRGEHHVDFNVSALPEGTYILRLSNGVNQTSRTIKVIH